LAAPLCVPPIAIDRVVWSAQYSLPVLDIKIVDVAGLLWEC